MSVPAIDTDQRHYTQRRPIWRMGGYLYRVDDLGLMAPEPVPVAPARPKPSPEQLLRMAVLEQALHDIEMGRRARPPSLAPSYHDRRNAAKLRQVEHDIEDALRWVLGEPIDEDDRWLTFAECCEAAGLAPEAVRTAVRSGRAMGVWGGVTR